MSSSLIRRIKKSKKLREQINKFNKANEKLNGLKTMRDYLADLVSDATNQLTGQVEKLPDYLKSDAEFNITKNNLSIGPKIGEIESTNQYTTIKSSNLDELSSRLDHTLEELNRLQETVKIAARQGDTIKHGVGLFKDIVETINNEHNLKKVDNPEWKNEHEKLEELLSKIDDFHNIKSKP